MINKNKKLAKYKIKLKHYKFKCNLKNNLSNSCNKKVSKWIDWEIKHAIRFREWHKTTTNKRKKENNFKGKFRSLKQPKTN